MHRSSAVRSLAITLLSTAAAPAAAQRIYVALESGSQAEWVIERYNIDGRGSQTVTPRPGARPDSVVIDATRNLLIWTGQSEFKLQALPLDGQPAWEFGIGGAQLALAVGGEHVYVGSSTQIRRVLIEPSGMDQVLAAVDGSRGIAVDTAAGFVYWIEATHVGRMTLEGANEETLIDGLGNASRLAFDATEGWLYWFDADTAALWRGRADGSAVELWMSTALTVAFIAVDEPGRQLYWGGVDGAARSHLMRAAIDGSAMTRLRSNEVPYGDIALDTRECGGHGVRFDQDCFCDDGWSGTHCECPVESCAADRECFGTACVCLPQRSGDDCQYYTEDCQLRLNERSVAETRGLRIVGAVDGGGLGFEVDGAGDVNADGYADLIIGTGSTLLMAGTDAQGNGAGEAYVVFGGPTRVPGTVIDVAALDGTDGFRIIGMQPSMRHGVAVAGIGDFNDDGIDDLAVGNAEESSRARALVGYTGVIFGARDLGAGGTIHTASLTGPAGIIFEGIASARDVSAAGDINDDGITDLIIGAPSVEIGAADPAQSAYVVFGGSGQWPDVVSLTWLDGSGGDNGTRGVRLRGPADASHESFNGYASLVVSSVGDIDADGIDDLAVGDPYRVIAEKTENAFGAGYVVRGHGGDWPAEVDLTTLDGTQGFEITSTFRFDGFPVAPAGDVNGDGIADMLMSSPTGQDGTSLSGWSYIIFGRAGLGANGAVTLDALTADEVLRMHYDSLVNPMYSRALGSTLDAAGDVNGDGVDDVVVGTGNLRLGTPWGTFMRFHEAYVLWGTADLTTMGRLPLNAALGGPEGLAVVRDNPLDTSEFSRSVAGIGDFNNDGFDDVAIGAAAIEPAGEVVILFGGPTPDEDCNRNGTLDFCDIGSGTSLDDNDDGIPDECLPFIVDTLPSDGPIDARQPDAPDGKGPAGWDHITLLFSGPVNIVDAADFELTTTSKDVPAIDFILYDGQKVVLRLDGPIPPGACTTVEHLPSRSTATVGFLPGDINGNGQSNPQDILALVDHLNAVATPVLGIHQCDTDRSGACAPADLLRLVDLLNGAGRYDSWNGAELPGCP